MAKLPSACPQCGEPVDHDAADGERLACPACGAPLSPAHPAALPDETDPLIGQTLGEFEIVERIGRGGMGAVYKAAQPSLGRFVAVKVLPEQFADDEKFLSRFQREARAAAAVEHPNIVEIFTIGEDRGVHYIAMELVHGQSLSAILKARGPLPADQAVAIMRQASNALAKAHGAGILHRDIKPSNILVTEEGLVKVADFGLAKRPGVDADVTQTGKGIGTPQYLAPECARGRPFDKRSDLYALGATFYHLLAGRAPFEGATTAEVVAKLLETDPPPLRELAPGVPRALARLVRRLLSKDPAARCQSAEEFLEALQEAEAAPSGMLGDLIDALEHAEAPPPAAVCPATPPMPSRPAPTPPTPRPPTPTPRTPLALDTIPVAKKAEFPKALVAAIGAGVVALAVVLVILLLPKGDGTPEQPPAPAKPAPAPPGPIAVTPRPQPPVPPKPKPKPPTPQPPVKPEPPPDDDDRWTAWQDLFDGKSLGSWRAVRKFPKLPPGYRLPPEDDGAAGTVTVANSEIVLAPGRPQTGIVFTGDVPRLGYELSLAAKRVSGSSDFCVITFPVGKAASTLAFGAGGTLIGLTSVDGVPLTKNVTCSKVAFEQGRWYHIRLRVTAGSIRAWLDDSQLFSLPTAGKTLAHAHGVKPLLPLGISTWKTTGAFRNIRLRRLKPEPPPDDDERWTEWQDLFDGKTLKGWKAVEKFPAIRPEVGTGKGGEVRVENGCAGLKRGGPYTGIVLAREFPAVEYEIALEARRVAGKGDLVAITFPAGTSRCSLVVGGAWNTIVGLQNLEGRSAGRNDTTRQMSFDSGRWYDVRLRVTAGRIAAWIDGRQMLDFPTAGRKLSVYDPWKDLEPLGLTASHGDVLLRNIRMRRLKTEIQSNQGPWKIYLQWPFDAAEAKRRQSETARAVAGLGKF